MRIEQCVACGSDKWNITQNWQSYDLADCSDCGLTFTVNPDYSAHRYEVAYQRISPEAPFPQQNGYVYTAPQERLRLEAEAICLPPPRLTPAEKFALRWLKANTLKSNLVIDIGCGTGRFIRGIEKKGFQAIGVEVSESVVQLLNRSGLKAIQGLAPDFSWDGPDPVAISFFEVLEHVPNPADVIHRLKERFPRAIILASVPSPVRAHLLLYGARGASDFPPHHFLRWSPNALRMFFIKQGYSRVAVELPPPVGSEFMPGLGQLFSKAGKLPTKAGRAGFAFSAANNYSFAKRLKATALVWMQREYQIAMDFVGSVQARSAARKGASAASMLVIAEP